MSTHEYTSTAAVCPFYDSETPQKVICEGVINCSRLHLAFGSIQAAKDYKTEFCFDNYGECIIAKALASKYEED